MNPLSGKELEYISDCISNEDLLIKQCVVAAQSPNAAVKQICGQLISQHKQHYQGLVSLLQEHASIAPKTTQEADQMVQMQQAKTQQNKNQPIFTTQQQQNQGHPLQ